MKLLFICAPYRGDIQANIAVARQHALNAVRALSGFGWYPVTPHLNSAGFDKESILEDVSSDLYWIASTQALMSKCDAIYCPYTPDEFTQGMKQEIELALEKGILIYRYLHTIQNKEARL